MKICEIFSSIQGESSLVGIPMLFIRLSGCNLRCSYCDTTYAYQEGVEMSLSEIIEKVRASPLNYVEITGGEPLLQEEVFELINYVVEFKSVVVETNGSVSIERVNRRAKIVMDVKTPGSGMSERNNLENLFLLKESDEVKFVITSRDDYEWSKDFLSKHKIKAGEILFSPAHRVLKPSKLAQWILDDALPVRLNLQIHKLISVK